MIILHATAGIHGYNGVIHAVTRLSLMQAEMGHTPILAARRGDKWSWPGVMYECGVRVYDSCISLQAAIVAALHHADVVHAHVSKPPSESMLAAAQARRETLVATIHALPLKEGAGSLADRIYEKLVSILLASPRVEAVAVPSPPLAGHPMLRHATGKLVVIPWGADGVPEATGWKPPDERGRVRVAYIGRLSWEKGFHIFAAAASKALRVNERIEVHVYGDGPQRGLAERLESAWAGRVKLHGWVDHEHIARALARGMVNVVVAPSLTETFSFTVAEAAWAGVPVVASRIPVHEWLLGEDYPGLVEASVESLSKTLAGIEEIITDLRREVLRVKAGLPTWEAAGRAYLRLYGVRG